MKLNSSQVGESVRMCGSNPAPRCNYKEYSLGPFYLVENGCDSKYNEDEILFQFHRAKRKASLLQRGNRDELGTH